MPWNGSGSFTLNQDFPADRDAGSPSNIIDADKVDDEFRNIKAGLEATLNRNGENAATANISMGGNKLVSVGDATNAQDVMNQQTADARYLLESNNLSDLVNAATARTNLGVEIGADVQAWSADLDTYAANPLTAAELGELQNIGSATISAAQWGYVGAISAYGATLIDDADASAARSTLGLGSLATLSSINNGNWSGTDLAVANGGTGASDAAGARTNLGLGTIATQAANNVNIDGGAIDSTPIGASTASTGAFTTLTASGNLTVNGDIIVEDQSASLRLIESDASADNGYWDILANAEKFSIRALNDAVSVGRAFLEVDRTGTSIDSIAFFVGASSEALRIDSSGNVGIGTTSPGDALELGAAKNIRLPNEARIRWYTAAGAFRDMILFSSADVLRLGNSATDGANAIQFDTENNFAAVYINNSGNVGIGTTSPGRELEIQSSAPGIRLRDSDTANNYGDIIYSDGAMIYRTDQGNVAGASRHSFEVDATERLRIDPNTGSTGGTGSAGSGNQYVELQINGLRYKLLHDGTI